MKYIGVAAYSGEPSPRLVRNAECFIKGLAGFRDRVYLLLGGYWGLMRTIADLAVEEGFRIIFTLPLNPPVEPPNNEYTVIIRSDLGYVSRSTLMVKSSDILVALGGGIGSILEIAMAYDYGKPVVVLESGMDTDRIPLRLGEYLDSRRKSRIMLAHTCSEAVELVKEFLGF